MPQMTIIGPSSASAVAVAQPVTTAADTKTQSAVKFSIDHAESAIASEQALKSKARNQEIFLYVFGALIVVTSITLTITGIVRRSLGMALGGFLGAYITSIGISLLGIRKDGEARKHQRNINSLKGLDQKDTPLRTFINERECNKPMTLQQFLEIHVQFERDQSNKRQRISLNKSEETIDTKMQEIACQLDSTE